MAIAQAMTVKRAENMMGFQQGGVLSFGEFARQEVNRQRRIFQPRSFSAAAIASFHTTNTKRSQHSLRIDILPPCLNRTQLLSLKPASRRPIG